MCTKFLGDGLCCGYDCYEETPMLPVEADMDAFKSYLDSYERALWIRTGCLEIEDDAGLADAAADMPRWGND